jgi:AraC-like DNA-binding protein
MEKERYPRIYLYRQVVQAKLFMDKHYADTLNLDAIADQAFFSKYHFLRLFKTTYGKTPHQYLISVRIENAKLLLQTNIPISEVCFSVGFESVTSFTALFKKITSVTPSLYRQQQHDRKEQISKTPLKFIPNCFAEQKGWTK